jgi:glycosyltransferase involved in cell wall biosynthesis
VRVGIVSTYPPTRCGIAKFSASLYSGLSEYDPAISVEVLRLVEAPDSGSSGPVTMEIDPSGSVGIRAAAKHLNRGDIAVINHEFGIYGPDDGRSVLDLATTLEVPALTVFHTVLPEPTPSQREIIQRLSAITTPVVLCKTARDFLEERYSVSPTRVEVVPHGSHWSPQRANHAPRRRLITWGLLGPGKGLERSLVALAELDDFDPPVTYQIVGRTHPNVVRNAGHVYRHFLDGLVGDLGLSDRVEFIDRYVADEELFDLVRGSDLVVVPYDNHDQVSSGVITEAVGIGRPVVATRFPYSEELLGTGAGLVVDRRAAREAGRLSAELSWPTVSKHFARILRRLPVSQASA